MSNQDIRKRKSIELKKLVIPLETSLEPCSTKRYAKELRRRGYRVSLKYGKVTDKRRSYLLSLRKERRQSRT